MPDPMGAYRLLEIDSPATAVATHRMVDGTLEPLDGAVQPGDDIWCVSYSPGVPEGWTPQPGGTVAARLDPAS